jgi:MFS family permease
MGAELSTPSNRAKIFSILSPSFSIGMLIGTLLGGLLAHPYGRLPAILGGTSELWRDWPFALPCVVIAAIELVVVITGYFMLVETKKTGRVSKGEIMEMKVNGVEDAEASAALLGARQSSDGAERMTGQHHRHADIDHEASTHRPIPKNLIRTTLAVPSFLLLTAVFLLFQISTFSWDGMYAVYTYTAPEHGGLGLSVDTIGVLYSVSYLASFAMNPLLLPGMTARWGAKRSLILALAAWVLLGLLIPISQWAAVEQRWVMWGVVGVQVVIRALGSFGWA